METSDITKQLTRLLKMPPLVQWLLVALVMWLIARWLDTGETYSTWQGLLVVILSVTGVVVIGIAAFTLFKMGTTIDPRHPGLTTKLVTVGIYQYSRNPMYLGMLILLLGWNIHLHSLYASVGLPLFVASITYLQIHREEAQMGAKFGASYFEYTEKVRRWL